MKRNTAWHKNNSREIRHTLERYIAILAIIALGVGFFSGLKVTRKAMVQTYNRYISKYQMYDYRLASNLGLTEEDVKYFENQGDMTAEGAFALDFIADVNSHKDLTFKAHSITDSMNRLHIISGRMAQSGDECLADAKFFPKDAVGTKIKVSSSNDQDTLDRLAYKEYTIVGLTDSVNYIYYNRGTTKIGDGSIDAFVYIPKDGFSMDVYSEIYLKLTNNNQPIYSEEYKSLISSKNKSIQADLNARADIRYQDILGKANEKIADAERKYEDAYAEYQTKKSNSMKELADAWKQLEAAKTEIAENEAKLKDGEKKITAAEEEYNQSLAEYIRSLSEFEARKSDTLASIEAQQNEMDLNRDSAISAMEKIESSRILERHKQLEESIPELENMLSSAAPDSEEYLAGTAQLEKAKAALSEIEASGVIEQYKLLQDSLVQLDAGQQQLNKAKEEAELQLTGAEAQLTDAKGKLDSAKDQINRNRKEIKDGFTALEKGKAEYERGLADYHTATQEAEDAFSRAEKELANARTEIDDGKEEIKNIPVPAVFLFDRSYNSGYTNFDNDSSIVDGIARILPIFFFLVAALVCSTTMTRMVDEQRSQIGTLKALGYGNGAIIRKYMFYSGSAAVIGCILGYGLGTKFFPMAIWAAYGMLYRFAPIEYVFDMELAAISLAASLLCSAGVTYFSCRNELARVPAELIRPKAPKSGKRILLERVPALWNKVSFLHKVSIRNIFRYKKRLFMTILGVAGCTALILAAFGINDSISNIVDDQFDTIMTYDYDIYFSDAQSEEEMQVFADEYSKELSECVFVSSKAVEVSAGNRSVNASLIATDDPAVTKLIGLYFEGKTVPYPGFGKAVINDKLAEENHISIGDTISVKVSDTESADLEVGGIFENYVSNFLFITGETYEARFGEQPVYQTAYAKAKGEELYSVSAKLSNNKEVSAVSVLNDRRIMVDNMMQSLNYIIWLVIACAGTLAFVVLYNLNNINITERTREIATIKVLGFYSRESYTYVFRESLVLTAIGALLGLGLGKLLHKFIMSQIKVAAVSFKVQLFPASYAGAFAAAFVLTMIVSLALKRKIDKINMAESLKSIE